MVAPAVPLHREALGLAPVAGTSQVAGPNVEEHPSFLRGIKNIWLDPHPVDVARATDHVIGLLHEILPLKVAQQFAGSDKSCISASAAVKGLQEDPSGYCVVEDGQRDILIFDARMPSTANVIRKLEQEKRTFRLRQGVVPLVDRV